MHNKESRIVINVPSLSVDNIHTYTSLINLDQRHKLHLRSLMYCMSQQNEYIANPTKYTRQTQ